MFNGDLSGGITSGSNGAAAAMRIEKSTSSSRSISAAGTVNASGADYAEYMRKALVADIFAKGEICGINSDGQLTKRFNESIHFMVKSTDPSYVGGDTWFNRNQADNESRDEFLAAMEAARQCVDRIAFCGQVPCFVQGQPGDFVIPSDFQNQIKAIAVRPDEMTLPLFMRAIGKIIKIIDNEKCLIIVGAK
jgi:hypothetical protein